jgi:hypothetical protein
VQAFHGCAAARLARNTNTAPHGSHVSPRWVERHPTRVLLTGCRLLQCTASLSPRRESITGKAVHELLALLTTPLDKFDLPTVLTLDSYPALLQLLADDTQKEMATTMLRSLFNNGTMLTTAPQMEKLLDFIAVLIRDPEGESPLGDAKSPLGDAKPH